MTTSAAARPVTGRRLGGVLLALTLLLGLLGAVPPREEAQAAACPCTVFPATAPTTTVDVDTKAVELGMKFTSSTAGSITGVRYWKTAENTGTHTGSLWDRAGSRLGTVTFANETANGWQQASFASPVAVKANTVYVISYYAPKGRYASNEDYFANASVTNGPLTALQNGTDGGQSVYRYGTGGGFPRSTYKASNYWVDAVFIPQNFDNVKPTLTDKQPGAGATNVARNSSVTVTFSEAVDPATLVMSLAAGSTPVPGTTSYDPATKIATLRPNAVLANSTLYTVTVSGAKDTSDNKNQMDPVTWTFTSNADPGSCPCSVWNDATVPPVTAAADDSAIELGVRFRSSLAGFVTGIRFYKGAGNTGTHVGTLWSNTGTKLASVTYTNETDTGWQKATFGAPVPVTANTTYVASYFAPVGRYAAQNDFFTTSSTANGPLTLLANGTDGANGVYLYGGGGVFPVNSYRQTNYWVDPVFDTSATDTTAPVVSAKVPSADSTGAAATTTVKAVFSEAVVAGSVAMELRRTSDSSLVPATAAYDDGAQTATLTPSATLAYSTGYTVKVSGAKDTAGNTMATTTWSFTTGAAPPPPPDQGPGGPIAVVTSSANPYSKYYAEILRTEGLNEFATVDVSTLSASTLAAYDVVVLGQVPVTADQATTLSTWVNGGGNLIAMRPSASLSGLLGLTPGSGSLSDAYLKVDGATAGGAGIVTDTMQFHGAADNYTAASGTQTVAALYSGPATTTATGAPAVTVRNVGTSGGQAAAFSYDLAKSVALTRQGNPAWAGTERDSLNPIRSDDMFFGGTDTDWVNRDKVAIPQADEQQRLLANLVQVTNRDKKPLPRFWYFPNAQKAVIVATGDDHANNGTTGRFNQYSANSPAGCSVADWTCLRYSSYLYPSTPLTDSAAAAYQAQGFEIGVHTTTNLGNYDATSVADVYSRDLAAWRARFPSLTTPTSTRMHAIVFSDWASQPKTEVANGIRMDTNYYWWPASWVGDRPGFMTGSGMPMRFTDTDGTMIDNYQANTEMTDESGQSYPYNIDTLLDNALGSTGYYGAFVANFHTDLATEPESDALLASAKSHGNVPIVSGRQMTTWVDGRNASSYSNVGWSANKLSFTVNIGTGANNITSMIPTAGANGAQLSTISKGGTAVTFNRSTIKGLEYAVFNPGSGAYTATYTGGTALAVKSTSTSTKQVVDAPLSASMAKGGSDGASVVSTAPAARTTEQTATVGWKTSTPASSQVLLGTSADDLEPAVTEGEASSAHSQAIDGLKPSTTYYYRVVSTDTTGKTVTSPAEDEKAASFRTAPADVTAPVSSNIEINPQSGGVVTVSWVTDELAAGGVRISQPGTEEKEVKVDRKLGLTHAITLSHLNPGETYLISVGAQDAAGNRLVSKAARIITPSLGVNQESAAAFRTGSTSGAATVSDANGGVITLAGGLDAARSGSFTSNVLDAGQMVDWDSANPAVALPTGAKASLWVRTGSTVKPDGKASGWTDWAQVTSPKFRIGGSSRYLQYRIDLSAVTKIAAPQVSSVGFSSNASPVVTPHE